MFDNLKQKLIWFVIGGFVCTLPFIYSAGESKALKERNVILVDVLCSLPKDILTAEINKIELPSDAKELLKEMDKEAAVLMFRDSFLKDCD